MALFARHFANDPDERTRLRAGRYSTGAESPYNQDDHKTEALPSTTRLTLRYIRCYAASAFVSVESTIKENGVVNDDEAGSLISSPLSVRRSRVPPAIFAFITEIESIIKGSIIDEDEFPRSYTLDSGGELCRGTLALSIPAFKYNKRPQNGRDRGIL